MAQHIGNYQVLGDLGDGQFGTVYLAAGTPPGRKDARLVAIKRVKKPKDQEASRLLGQEFELLNQVKHRGIVRVFEYLSPDSGGEGSVVMEHIHGVTLRQVLDELARAKEQVFTEAVIEIGTELADALYQAWTTPGDNGEPLSLIHRDLKPENVMITPQAEVKILDWGLARVDNKDFRPDDVSRIRGTPIYMAPEQARGEAIDHRTDLFALGLILYELLTKKPAYRIPTEGRDPVGQVYQAVEKGDLRDATNQLEKQLPGIGPVVTRLLQTRPQDRYANGHEVLVDLRRQVYRDRGAHLKEFCDFFFGTIKKLGDPPSLETLLGSTGTPVRRKSIEERLRESMSKEVAAPASEPNGPGWQPNGRPQTAPPSTPTGGPVAPGRPPPSSRFAPPPPDAVKAELFVPSKENRAVKSIKKPVQVGQRSPDETGMLEMTPVGADADTAQASQDPSATAFFAIPAPKAERGAPPPPPPGNRAGMMAAPPPPPGAFNAGPPVAPSNQGPTAGYGAAYAAPGQPAARQSPFQVSGPMGDAQSAPPSADERVQSNRVYAILFSMFLLLCSATFIAVWFGQMAGDDDSVVKTTTTSNQGTTNPGTGVPVRPTPVKEDTGLGRDVVPPPVKPPRKTPTTNSTKIPAGVATTATVPAPPAGPGPVTVTLADPSQATAIEIVCPTFRGRGGMSGGTATIANVPQESCMVYFKGGPPAKYSPVQGGMSLSCQIVDTTAVCK